MPLTIVTSVPPRTTRFTPDGLNVGADYTAACIEAWTSAGAHVVSVNPRDEVEKIAELYRGVSVIAAQDDSRGEFGRPLVYMANVLDAAATADTPSVALVNADILFQASPSALTRIADLAQRNFVFAHRYEVQTPDSGEGYHYRRGIDFFGFPTARAGDLDMSGFAMGVPWWDYWLPYAALLAGLPVLQLETTAFRHLTHRTNWSNEHWLAGLRSICAKLEGAFTGGAESENAKHGIPASFLRFALTSLHPDAVSAHGMSRAASEALAVAFGIFLVDELGRRAEVYNLDQEPSSICA